MARQNPRAEISLFGNRTRTSPYYGCRSNPGTTSTATPYSRRIPCQSPSGFDPDQARWQTPRLRPELLPGLCLAICTLTAVFGTNRFDQLNPRLIATCDFRPLNGLGFHWISGQSVTWSAERSGKRSRLAGASRRSNLSGKGHVSTSAGTSRSQRGFRRLRQ